MMTIDEITILDKHPKEFSFILKCGATIKLNSEGLRVEKNTVADEVTTDQLGREFMDAILSHINVDVLYEPFINSISFFLQDSGVVMELKAKEVIKEPYPVDTYTYYFFEKFKSHWISNT